MPIETRTTSALFKRAEQLKRWEHSETNKVEISDSKDKTFKIKFSDGCVFLAACAAGDTDEVQRLLDKGTDINTANVDGLTALHQACIDNNLDMVQFLVEHGCDVNRGDNEGWTPLHATASCGFLSIAKYLIENGANVAAVNNDGDLPIDIAEATEMEEYLSDVLDEKGLDCDEARSEEERIMLEDCKQMLNSNNFQDKIHPRTGASMLHVAASKGYMGVMNLLIQMGADLNAQDNDGWTPLHAAAHWGQKDACAILADNLANMDIQNFAGQTCFDVADADLTSVLVNLKKKQTSLQKEKPEIQAILQRTSNRPPLKRRTSVTRMSNQEKSKSVIKDTKSERAQIENMSLPEEETEDEKEKKQAEVLKKVPAVPKSIPRDDKEIESRPTDVNISQTKDSDTEKVPSWKKVLRRSSEENVTGEISEVILRRPKKNEESMDKNEPPADAAGKDGAVHPLYSPSLSKEAVSDSGSYPTTPTDSSYEFLLQDRRRSFIPPVRDEESELQRKAHAKRVRETRRSTQGVLLEDIKSAELQFLINTQKDAAKRQAEEASSDVTDHDTKEKDDPIKVSKPTSDAASKSSKQFLDHEGGSLVATAENTKTTKDTPTRLPDQSIGKDNSPSVTLVLKSKASSSPEDISPSDNRTSPGTQAAIQRRRRPKRRSTGVVYLDSDDAQEEKESASEKEQSSNHESGTERTKHSYGSSTSIPDAASETSSRYSSLSTRSSVNDDENDYKKLYEEVRKENEKLKDTLKKTEEELEKTKKQLQKMSQNNSNKNSTSDAEKKEKRALERKLSEMEEEIKNISKLKTENEKLKAENRALSRVVCKLTK